MDQISIVEDKTNHQTQVAMTLFCEESSTKTMISRVIVNDMLSYAADPHGMLGFIIIDMAGAATEEPHIAECKTCTSRVEPLMSMVRGAIEDKTEGYYTYCVVEDRLPYFRFDARNDKVISTLDFKRYQVCIRRFQMAVGTETAQNSLAGLAKQLPGVQAMVKYPCGCSYGLSMNEGVYAGGKVMDVVIHLNDEHQLTREEIADWLDSVHDPENGVDLAFKVPEKEEV